MITLFKPFMKIILGIIICLAIGINSLVAQSNLEKSTEYTNNARDLFEDGIFTSTNKAINFLNTAIEYNPENSEAHNLKAIALSQEFDFELSKEYFSSASSIEESWHYYYNLGYNYFLNSEYPNSLNALNKAESLNEESILTKVLKSEIYKNTGDYNKYSEQIKIIDDSGKEAQGVFAQIAVGYYNMFEYDLAQKYIDKSLKNNDHPFYYFIKGMIAVKTKDFQEAKDIFNSGLRIDNTIGMLHIGRGIANLNLNMNNQAIADFERSIENGLLIRGNFYKAITLYKLEEYELAKTSLEIAIDNNTKNPKTYSYYGKILAKQGELNDAEEYFNKAIDLNPRDPNLYYDFAWFYIDMNKLDNALIEINKAISRENNNHIYLWSRGVIYSKLGNFENALKDLDKSIGIDNKFSKAYHKRADIKFILNMNESAINDANMACKLGEMIACP